MIRFLLLCVTLLIVLLTSPGGMQAQSAACAITVQRVAKSDGVDRWWVWPGAGYLNWIAERTHAWEFLPWDSGTGFYNITIQSKDEEICKAFAVIFEGAGYEVR